jgi:mono/diheme cytochrome c family protein
MCLLTVVGCQQEMADQPSFEPMEPCTFFPDGRTARPLVQGTVARGHLRIDRALYTGRRGTVGQPMAPLQKPDNPPANVQAVSDPENEQLVDTFPIPITQAVLEHGYHRYMIYCVACHDPLGTGQGKIVERGYTAPPSYHIQRLREAPPGRFFAVITEGYGSMPSYGAQIPPHDRWAIAAYIRALQLSQHFPEGQLTPEMREQLDRLSRSDTKGESP